MTDVHVSELESVQRAVLHLRSGEVAAALELLPDFIHPHVVTAFELSKLEDQALLCVLTLAGDINPVFRERLIHVFPKVFGLTVTASQMKSQVFEMVLSLCMALILIDKIEGNPSALPMIGLKKEIDKLKNACYEVIAKAVLEEGHENA